jgi:CHAT domain-containing protein
MTERGRARAFLDVLTEARVGVADELTQDQRKREEAILSGISNLQKKLWKQNLSAEERKRNKAELTASEADLEKFHLEVRQSNPHYASVRYPEPIRVQDIQSRLLDEHTALIEYLLGEKRSLVWVVTKDRVRAAVLPPSKQIEEQVATYRRVLAERVSALTLHSSLAEISARGGSLYRSIFSVIENDLSSSRTVIIVPDGTLAYLPFEALVTRFGHGRPAYLAEKFSVVYGPSASALVSVQAMTREGAWPKTLLAFGDPTTIPDPALAEKASAPNHDTSRLRNGLPAEDYAERGFSLAPLPYAREEVQAIGRLFPASQRQLYVGSEAREEHVKSENLRGYRFIHFATHGFLDEAKPGRSGILLSRAPDSSEDGILQVGEIMRLKLKADLVTLSACSTGLGKLVHGEGVLGLTRAFFYSGAANVAVSLWNVNDSATASLMEAFYRNLNHGMTKSEAMRQAKLSLLRGSRQLWQHPYFWAAFIVEGQGS